MVASVPARLVGNWDAPGRQAGRHVIGSQNMLLVAVSASQKVPASRQAGSMQCRFWIVVVSPGIQSQFRGTLSPKGE